MTAFEEIHQVLKAATEGLWVAGLIVASYFLGKAHGVRDFVRDAHRFIEEQEERRRKARELRP